VLLLTVALMVLMSAGSAGATGVSRLLTKGTFTRPLFQPVPDGLVVRIAPLSCVTEPPPVPMRPKMSPRPVLMAPFVGLIVPTKAFAVLRAAL
jgi:hypothetical protein